MHIRWQKYWSFSFSSASGGSTSMVSSPSLLALKPPPASGSMWQDQKGRSTNLRAKESGSGPFQGFPCMFDAFLDSFCRWRREYSEADLVSQDWSGLISEPWPSRTLVWGVCTMCFPHTETFSVRHPCQRDASGGIFDICLRGGPQC